MWEGVLFVSEKRDLIRVYEEQMECLKVYLHIEKEKGKKNRIPKMPNGRNNYE